MSEPSKAVFLSYASQDTEAAKRIADALRSAGVEVWFDQEGGLEHGDEWDAKIRRQIRECVLFIPLISANTQARHEGYFRIEWELAAQRALGIASGIPFILPVLIDGTREPEALVPDRFRIVQWTKLPGGNVPADVLQRFLKLWSHRTGVLKYEAAKEQGKPASPPPPMPVAGRKFGPMAYAFALVAVLFLGITSYLGLKPRRSPEEISKLISDAQKIANGAERPAPAVPPPPAAPVSEARQLAAKAQELFLALDSTRDDFALAEDLLKQAVAKAPADAEVWAAYAYLHQRYGARGWDPANERADLARAAVQRALRLDPKSFEARFMAASLFTGTSEKDSREHEQALRALLQERPDDKRVIRALAADLRYQPNRTQEVIELYDRSAALPGGDPLALYNKALALWFSSRVKEANAAVAAAIAQQPFQSAKLLAAYLALSVDGDLDRAKRLLEELPSAALQDDRGCFFGYLVYSYRGEYDQALAILRSFPRDWINDSWYHGPKGLLVGNALFNAGRQDAAAVEWRAALKTVDVRLAANPTFLNLLGTRVLLLAKTGDLAAAREQFPAVRQMVQSTKHGELNEWYVQLCVAMGERAEALRIFDMAVHSERRAVLYPASDLRYNPAWKPLRDDPEFVRLLAEADRLEREDGVSRSVPSAPAKSASDKSVAVLAFTNLSNDKENEYFSDGISEELLTVLQKIPGLHVAARTSAFSFKGKNATAQEIGEKLGVANLVEGSVQKSGSRVKVSVHLSRAATGEEVWSDTYTRELKDVFALQEELALAILGELRLQLNVGESTATVKAAVKGGTKVPEAYQEYLQGKFFFNRHSEKEMVQALAHLQRAVDLDSGFALAWAGVAQTHVWFCEFSTDVGREGFEDHLAKARVAVERALALEPALPEGLYAKSEIELNLDFDWHAASETIRAALAKAPADPALLLAAGNLAVALGDNEPALAHYRHAVAIDPVNPIARSFLAYQYVTMGRYAEAESEYPRVVELNPEAPWAHAGLALGYVLQHRYDDAVAANRDEGAGYAKLLVTVLVESGRKRVPESDAAMKNLIALCADTGAYQIAEAYAFRGELDRAFEWLQRARRQRDGGLIGLLTDPLLENLHSDPRWTALLAELRLNPATPR